jgi:aldehyde dehydrogenase (NAD+)
VYALDKTEIATLFQRQKDAGAKRRAEFGLEARKAALADLGRVIARRERDIVAAVAADFGKPEAETIFSEIMPVEQEIAHVRKSLARWMKPKRVGSSMATLGTRAKLVSEPRGVCLIIAPWNYPFNLALSPLIAALAAGNSAIIKPSELTPATSRLIAEIVSEAFQPDLVTVVEGDKDVATALLDLPFDHIFFTGSPEVGKIVMKAAAAHLSTVTLELGGKSPTIVGPGADLKKAAKWIAFGRFANAGQTCIAPDHVFVHRSIADAFGKALREEIGRFYGSKGGSKDLALIVSERHAQRLQGLLDDAVGKGARIVEGGSRDGRAFQPTLIEAVTPEMQIDHEEIFGPILPIMAYDDVAEVIARINERPKPLALYIFERERSFQDRIIAETTAGGVTINASFLHYVHPDLPFGGVNTSGIGSYHGIYGFEAFSHLKPVLENRNSAVSLLFPPYTGRVLGLIRFARRMLR